MPPTRPGRAQGGSKAGLLMIPDIPCDVLDFLDGGDRSKLPARDGGAALRQVVGGGEQTFAGSLPLLT